MKTDLATTIIVAIIGFIGGYFLCNLIIPQPEDVKFQTINSNFSYSFTEPDEEIFNYRALNPTVEVFVGNCNSYNEYGECVDDMANVNTETETENQNENGGQE